MKEKYSMADLTWELKNSKICLKSSRLISWRKKNVNAIKDLITTESKSHKLNARTWDVKISHRVEGILLQTFLKVETFGWIELFTCIKSTFILQYYMLLMNSKAYLYVHI